MGNAFDFEIDDELLNYIHQPASLSSGISYKDSLLSMKQKMIVSKFLIISGMDSWLFSPDE